jgi:putative PIN family toxin of toxin-antitoxin system
MRAVLDTNVLLAAFLTEGLCAKLLARARRRDFDLVLEPLVLEEFRRTLSGKFHASGDEVKSATGLVMEATAGTITKSSLGRGLCRDPDDDRILASALEARVEYLVSGDADLLILGKIEGTTMIAPREFELLFRDGD